MRKSTLVVFIIVVLFASCKEKKKEEIPIERKTTPIVDVMKMKVKVIGQLPHTGDKKYIQGLEIYNGILYESTGLYKQSSLKKIDLKTGDILLSVDIKDLFAEGLTIFNDYLTLLSYREGKAISYNINDLSEKGLTFNYDGEGWGLTNNGEQFIMSDGSDRLYFRNPYSFKVEKVINVTIRGRPLYYINEMEYVDGMIYANVFGVNVIFGINAETGVVEKEIDATALYCSSLSAANPEAVLNGIAYDQENKTFYVTGKECPYIYQVIFE